MPWISRDREAAPVATYVHQDYPAHVYHSSGDGRWKEVKDEAAWAALGPEWGYVPPTPPPLPTRRKARA